MADILTNPNWPIPIHSSQMADKEVQEHLQRGGKVLLTYLVSNASGEPFVAEQNPEREKRRMQAELDGKQRL